MKKSFGFSLLECLLAISLLTILIAINVPNFKNLYQRQMDNLARDKLFSTLQFAHLYAITNQKEVSVCSWDPTQKCSQWNNTLNVFTQDKKTIRQLSLPLSHTLLHWRAFPRNLKRITFHPNGDVNFENGTFWRCDQNQINPTWAIFLSQSARVRTALPDAQGEIRDDQGKLLVC